jgi:hypothetical protein
MAILFTHLSSKQSYAFRKKCRFLEAYLECRTFKTFYKHIFKFRLNLQLINYVVVIIQHLLFKFNFLIIIVFFN